MNMKQKIYIFINKHYYIYYDNRQNETQTYSRKFYRFFFNYIKILERKMETLLKITKERRCKKERLLI